MVELELIIQQTIIGPNGVVIFVQIYTYQTVLSTFGSKQTVWAVYLWIGNVPKAHRRGKGVGRAILIGILPSVSSPAAIRNLNRI